ncbi:MAG: M23 family metallopeptidase [Pseudomonadota bacterium]
MKIIFVRKSGTNWALHLTRKAALIGLTAAIGVTAGTVAYYETNSTEVDAKVVDAWRTKLREQEALVVDLARKSEDKSAAVGRQLAQMQARLLRMEALGTHMADAADLDDQEFDFGSIPAQGGPIDSNQASMNWADLSAEIDNLSAQLKKREIELRILDDVLVNEDIKESAIVAGRPVRWGWLSSPYGQRVDPITGGTGWHAGVDFAGRDGSDVIAVASGVVTFSGNRSGYGKMVEISHGNGYVTRYAHHKTLTVAAGDVVDKGQTIGTMGSSGRSTGPHVHFEVLKHGRTVDPAKYVATRS